jgi:hypothetical protein
MKKRYYYDLHTHSCLSPCADEDNTPNNLLGMAKLAGVDILALTDHNSAKNCPAFFEAADEYGIIAVAGIELTTSEDIHVMCLFEHLDDALAFDSELDAHRMKIENRPEIFGRQLVLDARDNIIYEEKNLLSFATDISLEDIPALVLRFNGVCYPAHIDRDSNGIIAILGTFPSTPFFSAVEIREPERTDEFKEKYGLWDKRFISSSDAHYLTDIRDGENYFDLESNLTPDGVRSALFKLLRGETEE